MPSADVKADKVKHKHDSHHKHKKHKRKRDNSLDKGSDVEEGELVLGDEKRSITLEKLPTKSKKSKKSKKKHKTKRTKHGDDDDDDGKKKKKRKKKRKHHRRSASPGSMLEDGELPATVEDKSHPRKRSLTPRRSLSSSRASRHASTTHADRLKSHSRGDDHRRNGDSRQHYTRHVRDDSPQAKRPRRFSRSRSPGAAPRRHERDDAHRPNRSSRRDSRRSRSPQERRRSSPRSRAVDNQVSKSNGAHTSSSRDGDPHKRRQSRTESNRSEANADVNILAEDSEEEDEEKVIERRRLERQKLLASLNVNSPAVGTDSKQESATSGSESESDSSSSSSNEDEDNNVEEKSDTEAVDFSFDELGREKMEQKQREENEERDRQIAEVEAAKAKSNGLDMFSDDVDMFTDDGVNDDRLRRYGQMPATVDDEADDHDGYYKVRPGQKLGPDGGRYFVKGSCGSGMFSTVVRATDTVMADREVVVKVVRTQEVMVTAARKEIEFLKKINDADEHDRHHCIRLRHHFEYRRHICLVFEALGPDLRKVLKNFGHKVGLHIRAVQNYARQLFLALKHLRKCQVVHADIKPDNMVVDEETKLRLKLCDFGSAMDIEECSKELAATPYLVSRYYRAPEIIVGLTYDYAIDMWSVATTLYELFTGRVCFPGTNNNEMLYLQQQLHGKIPNKVIRRANVQIRRRCFADNGDFLHRCKDKVTHGEKLTPMPVVKSTRHFQDEQAFSVANAALSKAGIPEKQLLKIRQLRELLERSLALDPAKRMTAHEALMSPFIVDKYS